MLFNGGIIPLYLKMKEFHLTNTLVVGGPGRHRKRILLCDYAELFPVLPESPNRISPAGRGGEWRVLGHIILPLSKPIIATLTLFYLVTGGTSGTMR